MPKVMGILNVTPDSFSDGGNYSKVDHAVDRAQLMVSEGAWIIDVGGESTRPGATAVSVDEEIDRVVPVVAALCGMGIRTSIDTRKDPVARAAVDAGASMINDVSSSLWQTAADLSVGWIAMHMLGDPQTMQAEPTYGDVTSEVLDFLCERAESAASAGVNDVWIDPGFGFGKSDAHNVTLVANLDRFVATGIPVVVGASRKRTLGHLTGLSDVSVGGNGEPTGTDDRLESGLAMAVWAMQSGVQMIRTHDVKAHVHAATVVAGEFEKDAA